MIDEDAEYEYQPFHLTSMMIEIQSLERDRLKSVR